MNSVPVGTNQNPQPHQNKVISNSPQTGREMAYRFGKLEIMYSPISINKCWQQCDEK